MTPAYDLYRMLFFRVLLIQHLDNQDYDGELELRGAMEYTTNMTWPELKTRAINDDTKFQVGMHDVAGNKHLFYEAVVKRPDHTGAALGTMFVYDWGDIRSVVIANSVLCEG